MPLETRFELTYQDKISDNITIQPGLNYTINPRQRPHRRWSGLVAGFAHFTSTSSKTFP